MLQGDAHRKPSPALALGLALYPLTPRSPGAREGGGWTGNRMLPNTQTLPDTPASKSSLT